VSSNQALEDSVASWGRILGLDTEFQRTNTFFPLPGLYQVVSGSDIYLIDPLTIDEWQPLVAALEDEDTTLIMHACGEDLELMFHHLGATPTRLFDTQVANAFVTTDFALSYTNLVKTHLGVELGKAQTRSDWRRRPLSDAQLQYACEDVEHLPELHRQLCEKLEVLGRDQWYFETMAGQGRYAPSDPDRYYQNIRKAWRLSGDDLAVLQSLTSWRERTAMTEDVPRNRVVWDEHLLAFAQQQALSEGHVRELLPHGIARRYADRIVAEHQTGRDSEPLPRLAPPLSQVQGEVSKKLREVARTRAEGKEMAQELLARKRDVERCIRHYMATGELSADYSGWRDALVGESFRDILARLG
jgi:ribonuclease D